MRCKKNLDGSASGSRCGRCTGWSACATWIELLRPSYWPSLRQTRYSIYSGPRGSHVQPANVLFRCTSQHHLLPRLQRLFHLPLSPARRFRDDSGKNLVVLSLPLRALRPPLLHFRPASPARAGCQAGAYRLAATPLNFSKSQPNFAFRALRVRQGFPIERARTSESVWQTDSSRESASLAFAEKLCFFRRWGLQPPRKDFALNRALAPEESFRRFLKTFPDISYASPALMNL